jgi:hypothetical protein
LKIHHVIHDNNMGANMFSKLGSDWANVPSRSFHLGVASARNMP